MNLGVNHFLCQRRVWRMCTHRSVQGERRGRPPSRSGALAYAGAGGVGTAPEVTHTGWVHCRRVQHMFGSLSESPQPEPPLLVSEKYKNMEEVRSVPLASSLWWLEQNGPQRVHMFECSVPRWWNQKGLGMWPCWRRCVAAGGF